MEQAFQKAFSMTFEAMENELLSYHSTEPLSCFSGQFENKVKFDSEMQSPQSLRPKRRPISAIYLLHSNRIEAEDYLKRALELDPNWRWPMPRWVCYVFAKESP
jgi:hypothetical protein